VGLCVVGAATPSRAQSPPSEVVLAREAARALAEKGIDLYEVGRYREAAELFEQAEARFHAPTHLLLIARASEKLGRLAHAEHAYEQVVDEKLPDYASDTFRDAQAQARTELATLKPRVPHVALRFSGPPAHDVRVAVDGERVDRLRQPIALDPGPRVVRISADGAAPIERQIKLGEGSSTTIDLPFSLEPEARRVDPGGVVEGRSGSLAPALVAFGLGAVGIGVGVGTGLVALAKVEVIEEHCPTRQHCALSDQATQDTARTLGNVSTVALITGGVATVAGFVLLAVRTKSPERTTVSVGPGSLILKGAF
jgi:hypothetical protein